MSASDIDTDVSRAYFSSNQRCSSSEEEEEEDKFSNLHAKWITDTQLKTELRSEGKFEKVIDN